MLDHVLVANDVSINVHLNKILKSNLIYKKSGHIRTSLDYLHCFCKDVFVVIKTTWPTNVLHDAHHKCKQLDDICKKTKNYMINILVKM